MNATALPSITRSKYYSVAYPTLQEVAFWLPTPSVEGFGLTLQVIIGVAMTPEKVDFQKPIPWVAYISLF